VISLPEQVARRLAEILAGLEEALGRSVPDGALGEILPEVGHVFLHECLHEVLAHAAPWAGAEAEADPVLDEAVEVVVLVLESSLAPELGLPTHDSHDLAAAVAGYPVPLSPTDVAEIQSLWEEEYRSGCDIKAFADHVRLLLHNRLAHREA
jgi:hypothetical protein